MSGWNAPGSDNESTDGERATNAGPQEPTSTPDQNPINPYAAPTPAAPPAPGAPPAQGAPPAAPPTAPGYGAPGYGPPPQGPPPQGPPPAGPGQPGQPRQPGQPGQPPHPGYGPPPGATGYGPPAAPYGSAPYGSAPYGPAPGYGPAPAYGYGGYGYQAPKSSRAGTVMGLGIAGLVATFFTCGIGVVLSIVALALAPGARREIAASGGALSGNESIRTGVICAWISVGVAALAIVVLVIAIIAGAASNNNDGSYTYGAALHVAHVIASLRS